MREIGVDLHKSNFYCCYYENGATQFHSYKMSEFESFSRSLQKTDRIAVESTGNSRWFVTQVEDMVREVIVVNPKQFKVISESSKKTD